MSCLLSLTLLQLTLPVFLSFRGIQFNLLSSVVPRRLQLKQGYINQVERSGKKVGNNKLVAAFPDDANVGQRPAAGRR